MAAPLLVAGLSLLPKIPDMWNAVAGLFGKKVPKSVEEAGKLAGEVINSFKKGELSPEAQIELEKEVNRHIERIKELALEEKELALKDKELDFKGEELIVRNQESMNELEMEAYKSTDEFVRRTRPKMLRDFFKLVVGYVLYAPLALIAAKSVGFDAALLNTFTAMLEWIGGWVFGTFSAAYLGYTGARMVDKVNPNFKNGNGFLNKLVNKIV